MKDLEEEKQIVFKGYQCTECLEAPIKGKLYHSQDLVQQFCERCALTCDYAKENALVVQLTLEAALPPKFPNQHNMMKEEEPPRRVFVQPTNG